MHAVCQRGKQSGGLGGVAGCLRGGRGGGRGVVAKYAPRKPGRWRRRAADDDQVCDLSARRDDVSGDGRSRVCVGGRRRRRRRRPRRPGRLGRRRQGNPLWHGMLMAPRATTSSSVVVFDAAAVPVALQRRPVSTPAGSASVQPVHAGGLLS